AEWQSGDDAVGAVAEANEREGATLPDWLTGDLPTDVAEDAGEAVDAFDSGVALPDWLTTTVDDGADIADAIVPEALETDGLDDGGADIDVSDLSQPAE